MSEFEKTKKMFSERLKEARSKNGMTQPKLSEKTGKIFDYAVTPASISDYENGKTFPELDTIIKLASVLGVSIDWLCGYELDKTDAVSVPLALMTVLKKLKPRIEYIEQQNSNGINKTAATLIFDNGLHESIIAEGIKKFLEKYSNIRSIENQNLLSDRQIKELDDKLLAEYNHLPNLPDYKIP